MDYTEIKKIDDDTSKNIQEGKGPVDECLCSIFTSIPGTESTGKGVKASIMKVFGAIGKSKTRLLAVGGGGGGGKGGGAVGKVVVGGAVHGVRKPSCENCLTIPLGCGAPSFIHTTKRALNWKKGDCGKCGCDDKPIFLKDSDLTIKITTPDINLEDFCPCAQHCMPAKAKLQDNIRVTIEHAEAHGSGSAWKQKSIEFRGKIIRSCIEFRNPVKTLDDDSLQSVSRTNIVGRFPAIELIKSITSEPSIFETKNTTLAFQKLPSVSIESGSMNSSVDETSDVVVLLDDDSYEELFKNSVFSRDLMSKYVFRHRSDTI